MPTTASPLSSPDAKAAVTIRPATEGDLAAAQELFRSTRGASFTLDRALWTAVCSADSHKALIAEDGTGAVVGLAIVVVNDRIRLASGTRRRRYHLDELIVAPAKRRHGIGGALLEHVKEMAKRDAPSYILVNCDFMNVAARRTYEAAGLHLVRQSADRFEIEFR